MPTHQILHRAHPLAAQLRHQTVDVHKIVITDVLNEVVQRDEHARPAHAGTEGEGRGSGVCCSTPRAPDLPFPLVQLDKVRFQWPYFSSRVPAVDRYGGVFVPVGSDSFDELDERAAGLWDSVLGPRRVVEVAD